MRAHGLTERLAGVRAIKIDLPGFMRAFTDEAAYRDVRADFAEQVRPLVAAGAEVIIPAGGLPMLLLARESCEKAGGVITLERPQDYVDKVLKLCHFDQLFSVQR